MNAKFANASSDSRHFTKIARLNLPQSYTDPHLSHLVTQTLKPLRERLAAIIARITKKFGHVGYCSLKATAFGFKFGVALATSAQPTASK